MSGTPTQAVSSMGTYIAYGDGADPENFTALLEVLEINEVGAERDEVEVTHLLSPAAAKEFILTLLEAGQIGLRLNYAPTNATHVAAIQNLQQQTFANQMRDYQIVWPGTSPFTFRAAFKKCRVVTVTAKQLVLDATLRVTGIITIPD